MRPLALSFCLLILCACAEKKPTTTPVVQPAKVVTVQGATNLSRELPGVVRASQRVDLAFQVSGKLVKFDLKEGQPVQAGQELALLDAADYQSNADAARAERDQAQANFQRAEELIEKDFISKMDFEKLKANFDIASSNLERAEKALHDTRLIAPFAGVVARKYVENFAEVQAKQPILSLQDKENLEIVVNISESLLARSTQRETLRLSAHFDALPGREFPLYIKEFTTEADPQTQTFKYVLGIKDRNGANLLPGMTASVRAQKSAGAEQGALTIPLQSVSAGPDQTRIVWRVDADNRVYRQPITLGEPVGTDSIRVIDGIQVGDTIVVAGLSALSEGLEIKPITEVRY